MEKMTNSVHKGIFLFLLLFFSVTSYSQSIRQQQLKHDSIKQAISVAKDDTNKVHLYLKLIRNIGKPTQELYENATSAYDLSKRLNFYYGTARACFALSKYFQSKKEVLKSMGIIAEGVLNAQKTSNSIIRKACREQIEIVSDEAENLVETSVIYRTVIDKMTDDTFRVNVIVDYINGAVDKKESALIYADRGMLISKSINYLRGQLDIYGFYMRYFQEVGDHIKTLWAANNALELSRIIKFGRSEALCMKTIAWVYNDENQPEEATRILLKGLRIADELNDTTIKVLLYLDLGNSYNGRGKEYLDSAIFYYKNAVKIIGTLPPNHEMLEGVSKEDLRAMVEQQMGVTYLNKNDTITGSKYIHSASKVMSESESYIYKEDSVGKAVAFGSMAFLYSVQQKNDSARIFYEKALQSKSQKLDLYSNDIKSISEIYYKSGEYKIAYDYLNRFFVIKDSIAKSSDKKNIQDALVKYQSAEKEKRIVELNKKDHIRDVELKAARAVNIAVGTTLIVLLLVLLFTWYYFVNKRKNELLITEKKEMSALLEGQEKERERIAADLHDRLGSMLATVKLYFNSVEENIQQLKKENKEYYSKASSLLDDACEEVRKISHDLASGVLLKFGLVAALKELQDTVSKSNQLQMQLNIFGMEKRLPIEMESNIYRIVQELLNNTLKHANAKSFSVQLNNNGNNLNLLVEDDGMGFDPNKLKDNTGIGLKNVNERLRKLNAKLELDAIIGRGTTYIINIPLLD